MRNLKKILALVLALTMVLGLSISASAGTFTDVAEDDDYAAAIELLASLDVLAGMGDGTYNAAGSYTREQFTKILYVLVTGKDDGAAMYTEVAPFPDVAADRWSAGYINWAVQLGILVGRDDGLFHPTDVVNYAEACKMFLIAMGYSASMYTYPYGFIDKADSLKLFDDINGYATYAPANRGTVAQMAYNALFAEAPRFGTYIAKEGETSKTATKLLIMGAFGVTKSSYGYIYGTSETAYDSGVYAKGQVDLAFAYTDADGHTNNKSGVFNYADDVSDLIGVEVTVWSKANDKALSGYDIFLIEDAGKDKIYYINPYDVQEINDTTQDRVSFKDGDATRRLKFEPTGIAVFTWDGENDTYLDGETAATQNYFKVGKENTTFRVIDVGNDGDIDTIYPITPDFAKITALSDDKVSMSAGELAGSHSIMDGDDLVIALEDGLKKDDYVLVFPTRAVVGNSVDDTFAVIKAPSVANVKFTREDLTYDYFADVAYRGIFTDEVKLGDSYNIYLNANGYVVKAVLVEEENDGNWLLATDFFNNISNVSGQQKLFGASVTGYLADGTKKTFTINIDDVEFLTTKNTSAKKYTASADDVVLFNVNEKTYNPGWQQKAIADYPDYMILCYSLNDDGQIDDLKYVAGGINGLDGTHAGGDADDYVAYNQKSTVLSVKGTSTKLGFVDDNTVIFNVYEDNGSKKVAVIPAADMPELDDTEATYAQAGHEGGNVKVVKLVSDAQLGATTDKFGLIISGVKNNVSSSKANYTLKIAVGGEIVELTTKDVSKNDGDAANGITDALKTEKSQVAIGYAQFAVNNAGKVTKIILLDGVYDAPNNKKGEGFVLEGYNAVTAIPNNKGVALREVGLWHDSVDSDCELWEISLDENVYEFASDVAFYTIGVEPCGTVKTTTKISAATADALMVSTLTKDAITEKATKGDFAGYYVVDAYDTVYGVDVIMMQNNSDGTEDVVKAVFIYTTPVSGPKDGTTHTGVVESVPAPTPEEDTYSIFVTVLDEKGEPIEVEVTMDGETVTAENGKYAYTGLVNGTYEITLNVEGYKPVTETVTIAGADEDLPIKLVVDNGLYTGEGEYTIFAHETWNPTDFDYWVATVEKPADGDFIKVDEDVVKANATETPSGTTYEIAAKEGYTVKIVAKTPAGVTMLGYMAGGKVTFDSKNKVGQFTISVAADGKSADFVMPGDDVEIPEGAEFAAAPVLHTITLNNGVKATYTPYGGTADDAEDVVSGKAYPENGTVTIKDVGEGVRVITEVVPGTAVYDDETANEITLTEDLTLYSAVRFFNENCLPVKVDGVEFTWTHEHSEWLPIGAKLTIGTEGYADRHADDTGEKTTFDGVVIAEPGDTTWNVTVSEDTFTVKALATYGDDGDGSGDPDVAAWICGAFKVNFSDGVTVTSEDGSKAELASGDLYPADVAGTLKAVAAAGAVVDGNSTTATTAYDGSITKTLNLTGGYVEVTVTGTGAASNNVYYRNADAGINVPVTTGNLVKAGTTIYVTAGSGSTIANVTTTVGTTVTPVTAVDGAYSIVIGNEDITITIS